MAAVTHIDPLVRTLSRRRAALKRAETGGDTSRAEAIRAELLSLHRRALRRALASDKPAVVARIQLEMANDLAGVSSGVSTNSTALLLDMRLESARQIAEALVGPFEYERLSRRAEAFVALARSADDSVRITTCLADEQAAMKFVSDLVVTQPGVTVSHEINAALGIAIATAIDEFVLLVDLGGRR